MMIKGVKKILVVVVAVLVFGAIILAGKYESTNKVEGTVIEKKGFVITIKDRNGFEWKWNTEKEFVENDKVIIFIDNKGTLKDNKDDIVKKVKRAKD